MNDELSELRKVFCELSVFYGEPLDHHIPNPLRILALARADRQSRVAHAQLLLDERDALKRTVEASAKALEQRNQNVSVQQIVTEAVRTFAPEHTGV